MDPATLLANASCYRCYGLAAPLMTLVLLDKIAANIGGGGGETEGILTDPDNQPIATDEGDIIVPD